MTIAVNILVACAIILFVMFTLEYLKLVVKQSERIMDDVHDDWYQPDHALDEIMRFVNDAFSCPACSSERTEIGQVEGWGYASGTQGTGCAFAIAVLCCSTCEEVFRLSIDGPCYAMLHARHALNQAKVASDYIDIARANQRQAGEK